MEKPSRTMPIVRRESATAVAVLASQMILILGLCCAARRTRRPADRPKAFCYAIGPKPTLKPVII